MIETDFSPYIRSKLFRKKSWELELKPAETGRPSSIKLTPPMKRKRKKIVDHKFLVVVSLSRSRSRYRVSGEIEMVGWDDQFVKWSTCYIMQHVTSH